MTNKTITLSRETLENSLKDGSSDPVVYASYRKAVADIRAALADPVPPAGGEPEVLAWMVSGNGVLPGAFTADPEWARDDSAYTVTDLVDRAHLTMLQAEVERLKSEHRTENQALRSNFARNSLYLQIAEQLLEDPAYERSGMDWDYEHPVHDGIVALQSELTKARELLSTHCPNISIGVREYLSNQSAPADKGQGEAVARITLQQVLKAYDYAESHPHKYLRGTTNWCAAVAHSLNAEQPALVAAVMPGRIKHRAENPAGRISYIKGWNACLDELARLNSEPKP